MLTQDISILSDSIQKSTPYSPLALQTSLNNLIRNVLPENYDDPNITRTRRHLGKVAEKLSDEQLLCIISEFQFLVNSWLDEYEKGVFAGKTLREIINE